MAELSNDSTSNNIHDNKNDDTSDNTNDTVSNITSDDKSDTINDCDAREAARRQFYKRRIKKDNIKLEIDDSTPQEERRKLLLEYQQKYRDKTINVARGLLQEYSSKLKNEEYSSKLEDKQYSKLEDEEYSKLEDEEYSQELEDEEYPQELEDEEYSQELEDEEYMDVEEHTSWYYRVLPQESKINRMMLSEWMLDVPQDFTENWIMVPCPTGNRVRLISGWGETRAYSRRGNLHGIFPSALPGGNPDSDLHHTAAVDCIWIKSKKLFYILDVLYWSLLPFTNCEAEFRLFWIKNKFQEIPEFKERDTYTNKFPILTLQNINCNLDFTSALINLDDNLHPLDGLLFYHRKALYTFGETPLVTWLKPFMLPEVLGISVPPSLDKRPDDYINFEHHIQKVKVKKNQDTTKIVTNSMEVEDNV